MSFIFTSPFEACVSLPSLPSPYIRRHPQVKSYYLLYNIILQYFSLLFCFNTVRSHRTFHPNTCVGVKYFLLIFFFRSNHVYFGSYIIILTIIFWIGEFKLILYGDSGQFNLFSFILILQIFSSSVFIIFIFYYLLC